MQKHLAIVTTLTALLTAGIVAPRFTQAQEVRASAAPRQVMVKIEWVQVGSGKPAASKEVETLTVLAEEGKTAQITSSFSQDGVITKKTVHISPTMAADGIIALGLEEETQKTDKLGQAKTDTSTTNVRIKPGDTRVVKSQVVKHGGKTVESLLFITPTLAPASH